MSLCLLFPSEASDSILPGPSNLEGVDSSYCFPHFLGEGNPSTLEYESEKFPQGLKQGQKRVLSLKPPSPDHWNIASDLVLPLALDESR